MGHENLILANSLDTSFRIFERNFVRNWLITLIPDLELYTIAATDQANFTRVLCTMVVMKSILEMIHLAQKCRLWMAWVSLGLMKYGNLNIPWTMNLGGLHSIPGKGIHKIHLFDSDRLHICHDHQRNTWQSFWAFYSVSRMRPITW